MESRRHQPKNRTAYDDPRWPERGCCRAKEPQKRNGSIFPRETRRNGHDAQEVRQQAPLARQSEDWDKRQYTEKPLLRGFFVLDGFWRDAILWYLRLPVVRHGEVDVSVLVSAYDRSGHTTIKRDKIRHNNNLWFSDWLFWSRHMGQYTIRASPSPRLCGRQS